jgi:hypothetical protein
MHKLTWSITFNSLLPQRKTKRRCCVIVKHTAASLVYLHHVLASLHMTIWTTFFNFFFSPESCGDQIEAAAAAPPAPRGNARPRGQTTPGAQRLGLSHPGSRQQRIRLRPRFQGWIIDLLEPLPSWDAWTPADRIAAIRQYLHAWSDGGQVALIYR